MRPSVNLPALSLLGVTLLGAMHPTSTIAQAADSIIAIVGATIIDGNGGPPISNGTIVIRGNRIEAVGPRSSITVPRNARVIEGQGKFLTPGFIDTNVHVSLYGAGETIVRYEHQNANLTLEAAQLHLKHGITTIRDSYGSLLPLMQIRDATAQGDTTGPRMLVAGNIVGWGGPYSVSFSPRREQGLTLFEEQFNDFITQGSGEELMDMEPDELRVAINEYLDKGPNFIKYGGTSHFSNPIMIGFSQRAQEAIVEEAHKRDLVAETHSTSPEGLRMSILAGIDLIQHPEVLPSDISDELVNLIVDRGVICAILSNTLTGKVWERHMKEKAERDKKEGEEEEQQQERSKTSAELRQAQRERGEGLEIRRRNAQRLIRAGCRTTIATDNYLGSAPEFRRTPKAENQEAGIGSIIAIEGLVELGMTPMEAIVAATRNGGFACRMQDQLGTLEAGKLADVLVLDANPLDAISNIRKLNTVIRDGRIVDLDALPYERIFSNVQHPTSNVDRPTSNTQRPTH